MLLIGAEDELLESGVDAGDIEKLNVELETPVTDNVEAGERHDVLVIWKTEPSLTEWILGDVPTKITNARPVRCWSSETSIDDSNSYLIHPADQTTNAK